MTSRDQKLINEIEAGALDENTPIASVLRKCLVLGGRAGSADLRDWARRELHGYDKKTDIPSYRKVSAHIKIDAVMGHHRVTGQIIGPHNLPEVAQDEIKEEFLFPWSIGQIEDMARPQSDDSDSVSLSLPGASALMALMNHNVGEFERITALYWSVNRVSFRNVVDKVRTTCTELVAELHATTSAGQDTPTSEAIDQAIQLAVAGKRNTVNVLNAPASGVGNIARIETPFTPRESAWQRWRKRGIVVGISTIIAAVVGVATWLGWTPSWW
jgi:hypothetical protein